MCAGNIHGYTPCGNNASSLHHAIVRARKQYRHDMAVARAASRAAAAQTHHHPVLVVSCGCHTASQHSSLESFVSGLGGFFVGAGDDAAAAIPYQAAKDAVHQASNWNPERLIQAAQCGWALGEAVEGKSTWEQQCDPVEIILSKPPGSAR